MAKRRKSKSGDYELFLEKIPQDTRIRMSQEIRMSPVENLTEFTYLCNNIIAEIMAGNIPPSVAEAAQPYAELMYTAILSTAQSDKTTRNAEFTMVLGRLQEAANNAKTLEAKYVVDESFEKPAEKVVLENAVAKN